MLPPLVPKQGELVMVGNTMSGDIGWVMVVSMVSVHPLASVTVTVYVPAPSPVTFAVVAPVLHK